MPDDDDGARAAVVADRQVLPVRGERLGVGPEDPADVGGVVLAGVEVDVVGDLDGQVQGDVGERHEVRLGRRRRDAVASRTSVSQSRAAVHAARPSSRKALRLGCAHAVQVRPVADAVASRPARHRASSTRSPIRTPTRGARPPDEKTP